MSGFFSAMDISASGLMAERLRMETTANNIANANSTARTPEEEPYRRKIPTFQSHFDKELGAKTVELALAMFSAMMRIRPFWAFSPLAETNRDLIRSNLPILLQSAAR